jgi:hypothetical protein
MADLAADEQGRISTSLTTRICACSPGCMEWPPANPCAPAAAVLACNDTLDVLQTDRTSTNSSLGYITCFCRRKAKFLYTRPPLRDTASLTPVRAAL